MEGKKGFVLYTNKKYLIEALTNEQAGILFKHIYDYVNDKLSDAEEDTFADQVIKMAWLSFKADLKEDLQKWKNICERNRENGLKGGRPKQKQENPMGILETQDNPEKPKKADIDIDIDSDIDIYNDLSNSKELSKSCPKTQSKFENSIYNLIFETWNNEKGLIKHHELTQVRKDAMKNALKKYKINDIIESIENYAMVLRSNYRWSYKWDLETFLKQANAMPRFMAEGGVWNNFQQTVIDNPSVLSPEDRPKEENNETPSCFKNFFDSIK